MPDKLANVSRKCHISVSAKTIVDVIDPDLAKTFVTVSCKRLIEKPKTMKMSKSIVTWIENWLSGRKKQVVLRDTLSNNKWISVKLNTRSPSLFFHTQMTLTEKYRARYYNFMIIRKFRDQEQQETTIKYCKKI